MTERAMIEIPAVQQAGMAAAILGTHMSTMKTPLGFTFCPYDASRPAERWNFLSGCVAAYFDEAKA